MSPPVDSTGPQVRERTIADPCGYASCHRRRPGEPGRSAARSTGRLALKEVFLATDWSRDNEEWSGVVVSEGNVLNRRQNQRDLTELLRVKLGVATSEERYAASSTRSGITARTSRSPHDSAQRTAAPRPSTTSLNSRAAARSTWVSQKSCAN